MGTRERRERSNASDNKLAELFRGALSITEVVEDDVALAAVGGFGRGELAPGSDLDIIILHTGLSEKVLGEFVNALLYPLWSSGAQVDYSVRTRKETAHVSAADVKVILGLLDIRHIIGNSDLTEEVAGDAKARWRKEIKKYFPALSASISERAERSGELAFLLEPDLKEARGGLRDINALRAISESQLVDVALDRVAASEALISNARDTLHQVTGRGRDQLLLTEQDAVAAKMGFADADVLMLEISKAARAVDYVMQLTWHRINQSSKRRFFKGKSTTAIAKGIASYQGEVILVDEEGKNDAGLGLRAAAFA
ncbi:MAG: nucleotidyltransferase domain-containing protein, partial [Actinomycetes bacterium]